MAATPAEMLPVLAKKLAERMPRIKKLRRYSSGNAPMPEMGKNTRASWQAFQKQARTDYGGLLCASLAARIRPLGVSLGRDEDSPELLMLRQIWRDNRLGVVFGEAIDDMLSVSVGYLLTERDETGLPVITAEKPEQMITIQKRSQPWKAEAALKMFRDEDTGRDHATVWISTGQYQQFSRSARNAFGTFRGDVLNDWVPVTDVLTANRPGVPVQALINKKGVAEFEPHIDVIDRINTGKLNRLVTAAMQAFKQRAIKGGLPDYDEDGNAIDWEGVFEPAPGALWDLPEGIDIWESQTTDIRPLLEAEKADARDFAAVSQTNISVFLPDGQNQSAEGASNAKEAEIGKATNRIDRIRPALEGTLLEGLRILGADTGKTIEVQFAPPAYISLSEKAAGASQMKGAGLSRVWIAKNVLGMTPDEIARNEADLAAEALADMATTLEAAPGQVAPTGVSALEQAQTAKAQLDALGVGVRAGADPDAVANRVGLTGIKFTGAIPVALRPPKDEAAALEEK